MRYEFQEVEGKPEYLAVFDTMLQQVTAHLYRDTAMVIMLMYHNMHKTKPELADEMMWGYLLGITHCMMFKDKYPDVQITNQGDGCTLMKVTPPKAEG